jgi:hypothetical protein
LIYKNKYYSCEKVIQYIIELTVTGIKSITNNLVETHFAEYWLQFLENVNQLITCLISLNVKVVIFLIKKINIQDIDKKYFWKR